MTKTVVGLFDQLNEARGAVQELIESGIRRKEISLITQGADGEHARLLGIDVHHIAEQGTDADSERPETATGASMGAAEGGVTGLLVGLETLMIPGIGPVLAAGPLAAVLGGKGVGAEAGGMIGALVEAGVPEDEARVFSEGVRRGYTMVLVNTDDRLADHAAEILNRYHPIEIGQRIDEGRESKWHGFNDDAEPFAFDESKRPYKQRESSSRLDYGPGARTYLRGQAVSASDREFAELGNYQNERTDTWKTFESRFREDYERHYAGAGRRWEDYREAYRFGFDAARRESHMNSTWERIHPAMRESWDTIHMGQDWAEFEHAVCQGWEVGHVPQ